MNVGDSAKAVWNWLASRLPPHGLFRSAIFLRQGATDFFLHGSSGDRVKRFANIIDLSPYGRLSKSAHLRAKAAEDRKSVEGGKLQGLGDVSDLALADVKTRLTAIEEDLRRARTAVEAATKVTRGAEEWHRLLGRQAELERTQVEVEALLADEAAILYDAQCVSLWDRASAEMAAYWQQLERANARRADAAKAGGDAKEAGAKVQAVKAEIARDDIRLQVIQNEEFPTAERARDDARHEASALALETQIATARLVIDNARDEMAQYAGADEQLATWRKREAALPRLEAVASGRANAARGTADLEKARQDQCQARLDVDATREVLEQAERELETATTTEAAASTEVNRLAKEIARLQGRLQSRGQLTGSEEECPVCAQPLNESAHDHVRQVLSGERGNLGQLDRDQRMAQTEFCHAREKLTTAKGRVEEARRAESAKQQGLAVAIQAVDRAEKVAQQAFAHLEEVRQAVIDRHPEYAEQVDDVTIEWVTAEEQATRVAIAKLEPAAAALTRARDEVKTAAVRLDALRGQRSGPGETRGETIPPEQLQEEASARKGQVDSLCAQIEELKREESQIEGRLRQLSGDAAGYTQQAQNARDTEVIALADAVAADQEAARISHALESEWDEVPATREAYEIAKQDVERRRPNADRASQLHTARGQLQQIDQQFHANAEAQTNVDPVHRIPIDDAREGERRLRDGVIALTGDKSRFEGEQEDLVRRRKQAELLRHEIDAAAREAETLADLGDLLKDGGPLQAEVVEREQRRIVAEINTVLDRLGDALRVQLGSARRGQFQDIRIVDTSDPIDAPRYFEFLSGGEQFRVALALALALHRRVSKDRSGTIIVDEGFGALDGDRRDALARQMADTSQGILGLKLAESIILCSHSSEVQHHFPNRWLITKDQGTATVSRPDLDEEWANRAN